MRSLFRLSLFLALAGSLLAQKSPKENTQVWLGINCSIYAAANYNLTMTSAQPGEAMPVNGTYTNWVNLSTAVSPGDQRVQVYPGRLYTFSVSSTNWSTADLHFDVPAGYTLYMGYAGKGRTPITSYLASSTGGSAYTVTLELRPNDRAAQLPVGRSLAPQVNDVVWGVSLGFTSTGESAGTIRWRRPTVTTDLLNAINLDYVDPESTEVVVERFSDGAIKYIANYQCQVRVFRPTDVTTGYTINFYARDADPGTDRSFPAPANPFASYDISSPSTGTVRIIHTQDGPTEIWHLNTTGNTTTLTQLSSLTTPEREFEYVNAANIPTTGQRTVTISTRYPSQSAASVVQQVYQTFAWGEELISETADPGSGHANLTTTYTYHTSGWPTSGNAGKLASVTRPDGTWEKYDYYDDFAKWGHLAHIYRPWQDSPTTAASATTSNCHVTTYTYDGQRTVYDDLLVGTQVSINGTQTAGGANSYSFTTQSDYNDSTNGYGAPIRTITSSVNTLSGSSLTTTRKVFDVGIIPALGGSAAVAANPLLAGQLYSQTNPDGTRTSAAYSVGVWTNYFGAVASWDTYSFTYSSTPGYNVWRAESYFQGNSSAVSGSDSSPLTTWYGHTIESVYLTPYRSTRRDVYSTFDGGVVQEVTYVYTGSGNFKLIGWKDSRYSGGLPVYADDSSGAHQEFEYSCGRLKKDTRPDGSQVIYTRDSLYRVTRAQKTGVSSTAGFPAQGAINTDYTYNAADQVLTTTTAPAAGGLSLATSATYNLAGQLLTNVDERGLTTSFSYANGGRTVTTTFPGGATRVTDRWLDGSAKSITGTAVVPEHHQTTVNTADGTLTAATYILRSSDLASPTSAPRKSLVTTDWASRTIKEERPAPPSASPSTFTKQYYFNSSGQLTKTTETGLADSLFQYDGQGALQYSGLDLNGNGSLDLAGPDRVTQTRSQVWQDTGTGVWYAQNLNYVYNQASSSTALLQSETLARLVPYLGNQTDFAAHKVQVESRSYDVFRNLTIQTNVADRSTRLATSTTNLPDSTVDAVVTSLNGLKVQEVNGQNLAYNFYYDALGRVVKQTDPRTDTSSTARIGYYTSGTGQNGQVQWRQDSAGNQTNYAYEVATGRLSTETDPLGKVARYEYTTRGERYRTWGDTAYPVQLGFNDYGEQTTMSTYRAGTGWTGSTWSSSPGTADTTTWAYDPASGTLTSKTDADSKVVSYTYNTRGQLKTRTWARGVTTTYSYFGEGNGEPKTAELRKIDYSDSTTDLEYTYSRLGQTATVLDATGTRTFNYSATTTQLTQEDLGSFVGTRSLSYQYDTSGTGTKGRLTSFGVGPTATPTSEYNISYGYDTYGRMNQVWNFNYTYLANSNLIASIADSQNGYLQNRTYESNRDLLDVIETKWSGTTKAKFDYATDALGRRTGVAKTGEMFSRYSSNGLDTAWGYNDRSEVTSEVSKLGGTSTVLTGRNDAYSFDNIGNRASTAGTTHNGNAAGYTTNALNQYTQRTVPGVIDVAGVAPAAATVSVNGSSTGVTRHNDYYFLAFGATNTSTSVWQSLNITSSLGGSSTRFSFLPLTPEPFTYDLDGNMTSDGRWDYTYDAENRLVSMQTHTALSPSILPNADARRVEFTNDYLGRRVRKKVLSGYNGTSFATTLSDTKSVYNGWNLIYELNELSSLAKVRAYIWGLDWSGTLQGAGGVGGLLYENDIGSSTTMAPAYDGNGNLMAMLKRSDSSGSMIAAYEYDAFGNTLAAYGANAASNPIRFSTKYTDTETGLIYYGLRYYSPTLGRFINRDPIEERGGLNLYAFCGNNGVNRWDYLGNVTKDRIVEAPDDDGQDTIIIRGRGFDSGAVTIVNGSSDSRFHEWAVDRARAAANQTFATNLFNATIGSIVASSQATSAAFADAMDRAYVPTSSAPASSTPTVVPNIPASNVSVNVNPSAPAVGRISGEMFNTYHPGDTYNADGSVNPGGDSYFDFGPALARVQMEAAILDIQLKEIRSRESTAYDLGVAVEYWANSGGVRGVTVGASYDTPEEGVLRGTGGGNVSFTIDNGFAVAGSFGGKIAVPNIPSVSFTAGGSWNQMNGAGPVTNGERGTYYPNAKGTGVSVSTGAPYGALPSTFTFGPSWRVAPGTTINAGIVISPANVMKNFADIYRGFTGQGIQ